MALTTQYTRTEDGFNIAYATLGSGTPMVFVAEGAGGLFCYDAYPSWGEFMERLAEPR